MCSFFGRVRIAKVKFRVFTVRNRPIPILTVYLPLEMQYLLLLDEKFPVSLPVDNKPFLTSMLLKPAAPIFLY
jgi:hypothetical protein